MRSASRNPSRRFFVRPPRRLACLRGDCFMSGDDYHLDVVGALNAGLQAAWVVRNTHPDGEHVRQRAASAHLTLRDLSMLCRALGGPGEVS
ncbi:HAD hydrolase-like protein [Burkholderia sp. SIMBA_052]|uniref:HAD hydrolase-like protein n=1 Tax=unclassified Burkholderia TaxID=2613784 RepID=UPI003979BB30